MMRRSPSSRLLGAAGVAMLSTACGIIAGIEDFNLVDADAGPTDDAASVDVVTTDTTTPIDDATPSEASVGDGTIEPTDGSTVETGVDASAPDVGLDAPPDAPPADTGPTCSCPSVLQTCPIGNACAPAVLAQGRPDPRSIIVDSTNVVWAEWGTSQVVRCPTGGCGGAPSVSSATAPKAVLRHPIAGSPSTLFYQGVSGSIDTVQPSGGTVTVVPGPVTALGAALTSGAAAWAVTDGIWICLTGSGCTSSQKLVGGANPITSPAMFRISNRVFWTPPGGGVSSCVTTNCAGAINWGQPGPAIVDFDTDNTNMVVATTGASSTVTSYDMAGTLEKTVALGRAATSLVMNGSKIFVGTTTGVVVVDRATFTATLLYPGNVQGIAVGGAEIYWTDASGFVFHAPN